MKPTDLVNLWFEKWTTGDFENLPITDDFTHTSPYGTIAGKDAYLQVVIANKDKFLGNTFEIRDLLQDGDRACARYTSTNGDFTLQVSEWYYCKSGLIHKIVSYYNIEGEISQERHVSGYD